MIRPFCTSFRNFVFSNVRFASSSVIHQTISGVKIAEVAKKSFDEKLSKDQKQIENDSNRKCEFFPLDSLEESELEKLKESVGKIDEWNSFIRGKKANNQ